MIKDQGLKENCTLSKDDTDPDQQSLAFAYPRTGLTQGATAYLRPSVKIEFGARSDHWPAEIKEVQPYLAEAIRDAVQESRIEVKVMDVRRTFWEKATILHQLAHLPAEKPFPARYSRHYCDVAEMITSKVANKAANDEKLLKAVVEHKQTFYRSAWANYPTAVRGTLRLLPPEERVADLSLTAGYPLSTVREHFCRSRDNVSTNRQYDCSPGGCTHPEPQLKRAFDSLASLCAVKVLLAFAALHLDCARSAQRRSLSVCVGDQLLVRRQDKQRFVLYAQNTR